MSFGGGGGGALPNHEHTNIALDGGPLDFVNTTIASLSAGSTTYSNGAALQELVIGNPSDHLVVSAGNIPEWAAATGGTGANVENHLTVDFSTTSTTMVEFMDITLPVIAGGKCMVSFSGIAQRSGLGGIQAQLFDDNSGGDVFIPGTMRLAEVANVLEKWALPTQAIADALGQDITVFCKTGGNTLTWRGGTTSSSFCTNITALGA